MKILKLHIHFPGFVLFGNSYGYAVLKITKSELHFAYPLNLIDADQNVFARSVRPRAGQNQRFARRAARFP